MRYTVPTFLALMSAFILGFLAVPPAAAQEQVLYSFCENCVDGSNPASGLLMDKDGNLYGTTPTGGQYNDGLVYELSSTGSGWQEKVLHMFGGGSDGKGPVANLIMDERGNLYGTTSGGGAFGGGTAFELIRDAASGGWAETILHSFNQSGQDGSTPDAALARDPQGNLYGTTFFGGFGYGTVFELSPGANGQWMESILLAFNPNELHGANPDASLTLDGAGNLYGTTENGGSGGTYGIGVVFELVRNHGWAEKVLYAFDTDEYNGNNPVTNVIFDTAGNLYGTTSNGAYTTGSVFELTPGSGGQWTEKQLCVFCYSPGPLAFDRAGNLYTTIPIGGTYNYGYVLELTPTANGSWKQIVLFTFDGTSGSIPGGNLIVDSGSGSIYGVTGWGGAYGYGTAYELTP